MAYTKQNFEDGQTLKAEHLNKMEEGIAAPDWDQMVNRPFGITTYSGDILPEAETEYHAAQDFAFVAGELVAMPVVGNTYTVWWDGTAYDCVAAVIDGAIVLGNKGIEGGESTGEPFFLAISDDFIAAVQTDSEIHKVRIVGEWYEIKTVDPQFVTGDAFVLWVNITGDYTNNKDWSIDKTHSELLAAYNAGRIIMAKVDCSDNIHIAHLVEFDVNTSFHFLTPAIISTTSVNKRYMFKVSKDDSLTVTEYTAS